MPGSPTTEELRAGAVTGTLFVHQLLTVRPGTALDYLAAVVHEQAPLWQEYGHQPSGINEVLGNQHEVVAIWATSIADQARMRARRDATRGLGGDAAPDDRLVAWEHTSASFVTGGDTHLMTPQPGTVYGPADWDEATLDDWLSPEP